LAAVSPSLPQHCSARVSLALLRMSWATPYSDAATAIEQAGGRAVIATRVGSGADTDECIVTNAWNASFIREGESAGGEVMLALNCNGDVASAGKPGNSAASPAGREAKAAQEEAAAAEEQELEEVSTPGA
jgi:hypothetical protein